MRQENKQQTRYYESLINKRIRLLAMPDDPDPIPSGSCGMVDGVTYLGNGEYQLWVTWEKIPRSLTMLCPNDAFEVIAKE